MLKTVWLTRQKDSARGCAMLLGGFDGLHLGHRQLLSYAKNSGLPVGIMSIFGGKEREGLFTATERARIFKENGVDFVFELPFEEIKDLPPASFLEILTDEFKPKLFVCGEDFRFGSGAQGTPDFLKQSTRVCVEILPLVKIEREKVSSRTVKELLLTGEIKKANAFLGENFFLIGKVEKDRQVGRTLNFPTANIAYPKEKFPLKKGVYESCVCLDGKAYKGITNFGTRPTFGDCNEWTETYLDGFFGDLYGREIKVEFVRYLRDIKKFDSADDLKEQLKEDVRRVREND